MVTWIDAGSTLALADVKDPVYENVTGLVIETIFWSGAVTIARGSGTNYVWRGLGFGAIEFPDYAIALDRDPTQSIITTVASGASLILKLTKVLTPGYWIGTEFHNYTISGQNVELDKDTP
jgi:hypothetical protein